MQFKGRGREAELLLPLLLESCVHYLPGKPELAGFSLGYLQSTLVTLPIDERCLTVQ